MTTGVVGATGFVIMVGTISEGSTETLDLGRTVFAPDQAADLAGPGLDLNGSAVPGAAGDGAEQTSTSFLDPVRDADAEVVQSAAGPTSTTLAPTTAGGSTTVAPTAAEGSTTAQVSSTAEGSSTVEGSTTVEGSATSAETSSTTVAPTTTAAPTTTTVPDTVSTGS